MRVLFISSSRLGDAILMLRYVPVLENLGARCVIQSPDALRPLLQRSFPHAHVVARDQCPDEAELRIPLMSLPLAMQLQTETDIPATIPYLVAGSAQAARWASCSVPLIEPDRTRSGRGCPRPASRSWPAPGAPVGGIGLT